LAVLEKDLDGAVKVFQRRNRFAKKAMTPT
jgi:hypothetical protein